jgi:sugar phosphate isomerase/epimerase
MGKGLMTSYSRRAFLQNTLTASAAAFIMSTGPLPVSSVRAGQSSLRSIRLGGPSFANTEDPEALALAHRTLGYRAAYCPNITTKESDKIRAYADAFAKHDVVIAEVGRWCNLMDTDPEKRRKNLEIVTDGLALAEAIGARCCVDIAGSRSSTDWFGPHPENFSRDFFDAAVENARKIVDAVKPRRTTFAYEMMGWAFPDTPDHYVKLIKAIDRKGFAVHLDPCNAVNSPEKFYDNTALLNDCFDKLGKWIVSCHAKDIVLHHQAALHFDEVMIGDVDTGTLTVEKLPEGVSFDGQAFGRVLFGGTGRLIEG